MAKIVQIHNTADLLGLIPFRQLVELFTDWLELGDIGTFDSAACNTTLRKVYLDFLQVDCFAYPINSNEDYSDEFYQWSIKRSFKVTHLEMNETMFTNHSFRNQYLQMTGRALKSMSFAYVATDVNEWNTDNVELAANYIATTQQIIYDLSEHCPHLESLSMSEYVLDGTFCLLLTKCTRLQKLDISKCLGISSSILRSICSLSNLKQVDLESCTFLPNAFDFCHTPSLSVQTLCASRCSSANQRILASLFPNVVDITMSSLDCPDLCSIVKACPLVRIAVLSVTSTLSIAEAEIIADTWKDVTILKLINIAIERRPAMAMSEAAMLSIITKCLLLERFVLRTCPSVISHVIYDPSPALPRDPVKSALQILLCESISTPTLSAIVSKCPDLRKLCILQPSLRASQGQSVVYPLHLLKGSAVKNLALINCALVATSLDTVEDLSELVLEGCTGLNDATLASVAQHCPHLSRLIIKSCPQLTATALIEIIEHCSELQHLSFLTHGNEEQSYLSPLTSMQKLAEALVRKQCPKIVDTCIN